MIVKITKNKGMSRIQLILTLIYVTTYIVNFIVLPESIMIKDVELSLAVFIFPFLYSISDIFSEVWGYRASRSVCYSAAAMSLLVFILFKVVGYPTNSFRLFVAMNVAFIIGDYVNDRIFYRLKRDNFDTQKGFMVRALLSSCIGELIDNLLFVWIIFGMSDFREFIRLVSTVTAFRLMVEIVVLPLTYLTIKWVLKREIEPVRNATKTFYSYDNKQIRR